MSKRKYLNEFRRLSGLQITENDNYVFDFNKLPQEIKDTLDEYDIYSNNYDWNDKADELGDEFRDWITKNYNQQLSNNIDDMISRVEEDIEHKQKEELSEKRYKSFEQLIIPVMGDSVLTPTLNKYEEEILMDHNLTIDEIEKALKDAKNIINSEGGIDMSKIEDSTLFNDRSINIPAFERFVGDNPEYEGVYKDWEKLFDEYMDLSIKELNAYRDTTTIDRMVQLRDTLIEIKKII